MIKKVGVLILFSVFACVISVNAQTKKLIKEGNKQYNNKDYNSAITSYNKALQIDPKNDIAQFNLGNAYYQKGSYDTARTIANAIAKNTTDKQHKAAAFYTIGNTYMKEKKWKEAIDAYKQSLRNNPQDADAKYNLAYAQQMLKKEQQQNKDNKNKDDKDKKEDKDDKKDKKDDNKKDDKKQDDKGDKKDDKNKGGDDKNDPKNKDDKKDKGSQGDNNDKKNGDDKNKPKPMPSKISEQQADQLLNALQQEEKKLQDKLKQGKGVPVKVDKDW